MSPSTQAMQRDDVENPGMLWVQQGADQFARDCEACHTPQSLLAAPTRFPGWSATLKRPATLGQQIRACQTRPRSAVVQREPAASDPLAIETWLASRARGQAIQPAMDRREQRDLALGRRLYSTRLGQLGLSCADCHDALAGRRLAGSTIPQGHPTGYPIYRLEWQTVGDLGRRLAGCMTGVRAEPFQPDSREMVALQLYLRHRAAGMVIESPGVRP
jgi:L-cysteine S-thiosulfotransferase